TALGRIAWASTAMAATTAPDEQSEPVIAPAGSGAAIVAWMDYRTGNYDIFAQRMESRYGTWGLPDPNLISAFDNVGDQGGWVRLDWYASARDVLPDKFISHYTIWRALDPAAAAAMANVPRVKLNTVTRSFTGPAIRVEQGPGGQDYFWELVGTEE